MKISFPTKPHYVLIILDKECETISKYVTFDSVLMLEEEVRILLSVQHYISRERWTVMFVQPGEVQQTVKLAF